MDMNYDLSGDTDYYTSGSLEDIDVNMGMRGTNHQLNNVYRRPPAPFDDAKPRKKRRNSARGSRTTPQKCSKMQNLSPPRLTGFSDTIVVRNPFDDTPSSRTCQTMPMNMGTNMIGQQIQSHRTNGPSTMAFGSSAIGHPTRSMTNGLNARNVCTNLANTRLSANHMNNSSFSATNRVSRNLVFPDNGMGENLQNGPMTIKQEYQNDQMENHQLANMGNRFNNISVNNHATNIPINVNTRTHSNQRQLLNQQPNNLPINNFNNVQQTPKFVNFNDNLFDHEVFDVDLLVNSNESIILTNQISRPPRSPDDKNQNGSLENMRQNEALQQSSHLQRILSMPPKRRSRAKTYPANRPVIFNYENPHAPPIYPCGICQKPVSDNDQGIICESGCRCWFHRQCLGLSENAFHLLTQELYAEWVCDDCLRTKKIPMVKYKS